MLDALHQILDTERNYPLCLMDSVGRNQVGIVVGCLRKLQRWVSGSCCWHAMRC